MAQTALAKTALAKTAKIAAAGRARESERPDRLFDDPLAAVLAGPDGFAWRQSWRLPGMPEDLTIAARTRFFDDLITLATSEGTRQVVLVAAGLDTRAFRLLETHGWAASVSDFHAVARTFGRWPPAGMTESTAAGIAGEAQIFFVSAEVVPTSRTPLPAAGNDK